MGKTITRLASESPKYNIVCGVDHQFCVNDSAFKIVQHISDAPNDADCIIDFSNPSSLNGLLEFSTKNSIPLVLATTGYTAEQVEQIKEASQNATIFFSFNMSLGISLLANLAKQATKVLGLDYDIEIIERHHNQKLDAPSGTAVLLADEIMSVRNNEIDSHLVFDRHSRRAKRDTSEIGMSSIRGGTIVGEHTILFAGNNENIELTHSANSREVFANGALRAGEFIAGKPTGIYAMSDLVSGTC
jgi:4-hydroxy-tetrahydrodipicolinate reductase